MPKYILGFDVGGTKISAVLGDDSGNILGSQRKPTVRHLGRKKLAEDLINMGHSLLDKFKLKRPDAIGVIFAGLVDSEKGEVLTSPNILGLKNFAISKFLEQEFKAKVFLENDATAATIAERIFGSGKNYDNFVYLTLSTGIGGGAFIGGKLYRGAHGMAGEMGHMVVMSNGPVCGCGRRGCLEAVASGRGIARRVAENVTAVKESELYSKIRPPDIDAKKVFEFKNKGDMLSQLIIEETIYYLAVGIVNIIDIFDPEAVIIGGGIANAGDELFKPLRVAVQEEFKSMQRPVKIIRGLKNGHDLSTIALPLYRQAQFITAE
ncbi:MAG: ROK family protein [Candidatus Thermoplasmatota archaeon]|nr:ROK family protein [Candidatus Thermoplasmatota archaeon]MCL5955433.1 ROK family protein [Candidatus Thermoplasmatota archaeon]